MKNEPESYFSVFQKGCDAIAVRIECLDKVIEKIEKTKDREFRWNDERVKGF